jgi:hypothetical protein
MRRSIQSLLESWSSELSSRANRVRALIGDAHWLSDGMHKERLLQGFIEGLLPAVFSAEHGFLVDIDADRCSNEIDVFIRDTAHSAPFFRESGITICAPESILAYYEIKSTFSSGALSEALELIHATQTLCVKEEDHHPVWRAICFFDGPVERTPESYLKTIREQVTMACDARKESSLPGITGLPICILCLDRFCAFVSPSNEGKRGKIKFFAAGQMSLSIGLVDMLSHVYARTGVRGNQPLEGSIDEIIAFVPSVVEF